MSKSSYRSLSDVVKQVQEHLKVNKIRFTQHPIFENQFLTPAGILEIRGTGLKPVFLVEGHEVKFSEIREAVTNVPIKSEEVKEMLQMIYN